MNSDENDTAVAQAAPASPVKQASEEASEPAEKHADAPAAATDITDKSASAADESKTATEPENFDAIVRIARESSVRKLISFVMSRIERGGQVTLQALNMCVHKAITIALIVRDRLGNIHQVNSLLVVQESKENDKSGQAADETAS